MVALAKKVTITTLYFLCCVLAANAQDISEQDYSKVDLQQIINILTMSPDDNKELLKQKGELSKDVFLADKLNLPLLANGNVDFMGVDNKKTSVSNIEPIASEFYIYPNPVIDQLLISYQLPQSISNVKIVLTDLLGNELQLLSEGNGLGEGVYMEYFTLNVSSGVYFITFNVDGVISTRKITVIN